MSTTAIRIYENINGIGETFFAGSTTTTLSTLTDVYQAYIAGWTSTFQSTKDVISGAPYFGFVTNTYSDKLCVTNAGSYPARDFSILNGSATVVV